MPSIYVASLSDYNSGRLIGDWIDLELFTTADEIGDQIQAILKTSREPIAEEWAIHDHEGFPAGLIGEYTSLKTLETLLELIEEHGVDAVDAATDIYCDDIAGAAGLLSNGFGVYDSAEDYGYEWIENSGDLPAHYENYFDFQRFGEDLLMDQTSTESGGKIYVFCS